MRAVVLHGLELTAFSRFFRCGDQIGYDNRSDGMTVEIAISKTFN